jgi:hypothetical protein
MRILLGFNPERLGGEQVQIPLLDELNRSQNRFRLHRDAELRLVVEGALNGSGVEVNGHAPNPNDLFGDDNHARSTTHNDKAQMK